MSLTAFVLIALEEAKDICKQRVNVSVCHRLLLASLARAHPPGRVRCCIRVIPGPPSAIAATTAAIMPIKP